MGQSRPIHQPGTRRLDRQRRLAEALIVSLGLEGAIHACRANCWDGVLACVMEHPEAGNLLEH